MRFVVGAVFAVEGQGANVVVVCVSVDPAAALGLLLGGLVFVITFVFGPAVSCGAVVGLDVRGFFGSVVGDVFVDPAAVSFAAPGGGGWSGFHVGA